MKLFNVIMGCVATAFMGGAIFAQQPNQQPNQPQNQQPNQGQNRQTQPSNTQQHGGTMHLGNDALAACLAIENQEEIQLAQFAKEKAKDKEVKEFASMLVNEHNAILASLRRVAPNTSQIGTLKGTTNTDKSFPNDATSQNRNQTLPNQTENRNQSTPFSTASSQTPINSGSNTLDVVQLHRELAEQCISDSKERLSQKSDNEFDKCFIGMQIAKHAAMETKLTVLQRHTNGELKNVVSQGLNTTKKHLKQAESIMERLDDNDSSKGKGNQNKDK